MKTTLDLPDDLMRAVKIRAVVSVDRRSFPVESGKVTPIGHGIDLSEFHCAERQVGPELRLLALGRTSPAKGLDTVIRGLARLHRELRRSLRMLFPQFLDLIVSLLPP